MTDQLTLPVTERDKARRVLETMEEEPLRRYLLEKCRKYARGLYRQRAKRDPEATVCADDVRDYLETVLDPPEWLSRNFLGACFLRSWWKPVGYTRSETEGSHGNLLRTWRLDERVYGERDA